jgi:integral membrane protein
VTSVNPTPAPVVLPQAGPLIRYRVLAYATGVFLLLLTAHVLIQWQQSASQGIGFTDALGLGTWLPGGEHWVPMVHGYLYLAYVVVAVDLWLRTRLPVVKTALVVLAGTVPFMSFVAERWVRGHVVVADAAGRAASGPGSSDPGASVGSAA